MALVKCVVLLLVLGVAGLTAATPTNRKTPRREMYGDCSTTQMPKDFDLKAFTDKTWYEIQRLRNDFEENTDCVRFDFFLDGTKINIAITGHFINYTEGTLFGDATVQLTGNETNIQATFPGEKEALKLVVLNTDFNNYAILYGCRQISNDSFGVKEEKAWVLSRKPYFDKPMQVIVDDVLRYLPEDFTIFLDDVNTFCKPGC